MRRVRSQFLQRGSRRSPAARDGQGGRARRHVLLTVVTALAVGMLVFAALTTGATNTRAPLSSFGTQAGALGGQVATGVGVAVNRNGVGGGAMGEVYVASFVNKRIDVFSASGTWVRSFGFDVASSGEHNTGTGLEVCQATSSPADVCKAGVNSAAAGSVANPEGLGFDQATGNVFVADNFNRRINVFTPAGQFQGAFGFNVNAAAPAPQLQFCTTSCQAGTNTPLGGGFANLTQGPIAVSPANGHVYVGDRNNARVNEFALTLDGSSHVTGVTWVQSFGWDVVASGEHNSSGVEQQTVTINPALTSGTFTLSYGGAAPINTSAPITWNATPAEVDAALEGIAGIGAGNLTVTSPNPGGGGVPGGPYTVTFDGTFVGNDPAQMGTASGLVSIATAVPGGALELCRPAASPTDVCKAGTNGTSNGQFAAQTPTSIAVSSAGLVFVASGTRVQVFNPDGTFNGIFGSSTGDCPTVGTTSSGVAVDPATQHVFVTQKPTTTTYRLCEFDTDGTLLDASPSTPITTNASGYLQIAIGTGDRNYVNTPISGQTGAIYMIGPIPPPDVAMRPANPVTAITTTSATFHGTVSIPNISPPPATKYHFEYSANGIDWTKVPDPDAVVGNGSAGSFDVTQTAADLEPNTAYSVRLVATDGVLATSEPVVFTTESTAPSVAQVAAGVEPGRVTLSGWVNPRHQATGYRFEWGTTTAYGNSTPTSYRPIGSGTETLGVSETLTGLVPATTYHFRLVAKNATDTTASLDQTFTTADAEGVIGGRVAELVSPLDKGWAGAALEYLTNQTVFQAAPDGDAVLYPIAYGLAGADSGGDLRYLARRDADGWSSTQLDPSLSTTPIGQEGASGGYRAFSEDLSCGVLHSSQPLVPGAPSEPIDTGGANLYARDANGAYRLLTALAPTNPGSASVARVADRIGVPSSDCRHVVWETKLRYPGLNNSGIYQSIDGVMSDVGIMPDGSPASNAALGLPRTNLDRFPENAVANDASHVYFSATSNSGDDIGKQALYLREGNTTTKVSATEAPATGVNQKAIFQIAAKDGSRVAFLDNYGLATPSSTGPVAADCKTAPPQPCALYVYDVETGDLTDVSATSDPANTNGANVAGVLAASDDLSRIYFAARGRLDGKGRSYSRNVAEQTFNVYLSDDGAISHVGLVRSAELAINVLEGPLLMRGGVNSDATADGRSLLFMTAADVVGYDSGGVVEAYLYSLESDGVICVSCRRDREPSITRMESLPIRGNYDYDTHRRVHMSDDGSRVFFVKEDALTPDAVDGFSNIYVWDKGTLQLLTTGGPNIEWGVERTSTNARIMGASQDGDDVFVATVNPLDPRDKDGMYDLYDFRVGGSVPDPSEQEDCDALLSCQTGGSSPFAPLFATSGSGSEGALGERAKFSIGRLSSAQRSALARGRAVSVAVKVTGRGKVTVRGTTRIRGLKATVLAASRTASGAGKVVVPVRLAAPARRVLARGGRLRVALRISYSASGKSLTSVLELRGGRRR